MTRTVETGTETLSLPVTVRGNVVDATKLTLEVTALDNAGADGRTMAFNFGDLVKGISVEELVGTFRVRLLKDDSGVKEIPFNKAPKYSLVGGSAVDVNLVDDPQNAKAESEVTTKNNVLLKFNLGSIKGLDSVLQNTEKLTVTANAKENNVEVGQFTDSSIKIKITLDEADNPKK